MIRAPGGQVRIEAVAHHGHGIGLAFQYGQLGYHGLGLGQLIFSAVRHQYTAGTDGGVEHLHQPLLGTYVEIVKQCHPGTLHVALFQLLAYCGNSPFIEIILFFGRNIYFYFGLLVRTVGI